MIFSLFLYALKSSIVLCVLYGAYHVLFKKNSHFQTRRSLMLLILGAALLLPVIEYNTSNDLAPENPSIEIVDELETSKLEKELLTKKEKEIGSRIETNLSSNTHYDWLAYLTYVYGAGLAIAFLLFLIEIGHISRIIHSAKARHDLDRIAITHQKIRFPFSFWRWIFLPAHLTYNDTTWKLIQEHENVHLQQGHSIDVFISSLVKCLLWFNPVIYLLQKSMKDNHEALADRSVLKDNDISNYSKALLEVCMQTGSLNLGHSFALKSNLAKRLNTMNMSPTGVLRSVLSLMIFALIGFGVFTQTSMHGRSFYQRTITPQNLDEGFVMMPYGARILSARHQLVIQKLQNLHPEKEYRFHYMSENQLHSYSERATPRVKTEFFDRLSGEDKKSMYGFVLQDSTQQSAHLRSSGMSGAEINELIWQYIEDYQNYIVIYEWLPSEILPRERSVFEMDEVDVLPEPFGGLENFERTIALDIELPDHINKADLPDKIEFSFVVEGANQISYLDLVTELTDSSPDKEEIYQFFRQINDSILSKIRSYYGWKRGIKDGEKVDVRMIVSIPTEYM
ncbi:MAG: M56 family metallopeptidase [Roseivirga sp.]|nr:M56 family metallopeptidase [Roseivirga sp.]